jgi:hypothetical protein
MSRPVTPSSGDQSAETLASTDRYFEAMTRNPTVVGWSKRGLLLGMLLLSSALEPTQRLKCPTTENTAVGESRPWHVGIQLRTTLPLQRTWQCGCCIVVSLTHSSCQLDNLSSMHKFFWELLAAALATCSGRTASVLARRIMILKGPWWEFTAVYFFLFHSSVAL